MTAQYSDTVVYQRQSFDLTAANGDGLFEPQEHGLDPQFTCTACYRGFICEYRVKDSRLFLEKLHISDRNYDSEFPETENANPPALNGSLRRVMRNGILDACYSKVGLFVPYSGGMIIARDFIEALYEHMGFAPAWKYKRSHELIFQAGRLISAADTSARMAEIRERYLLYGREGFEKDIVKWINDSFSLKYPE